MQRLAKEKGQIFLDSKVVRLLKSLLEPNIQYSRQNQLHPIELVNSGSIKRGKIDDGPSQRRNESNDRAKGDLRKMKGLIK